ncbi:MAG TPA: branched-chain amino acid ABC transporter permease [Candidatus Saccharimonadales bacterium]|nr:branched-chain amino acid ABC transporter permease [Candidatus Saccharimonadales bacterium]
MIDYLVSVLTLVSIFAILAIGLNVQWGWTGMLNLTYITFVAVGAYVSAGLDVGPPIYAGQQTYILSLSLPFPVAALGGTLAAGAAGALIGAIALRRLRADYFAIVTLSLGLVVYQVVAQNLGLFGGQVGMFGIPQPFANNLPFSPEEYTFFYLGLCLFALACVYLLARHLYRSPFGRTLRAIRDDEVAAQAFARPVFWFKLRAFILGSLIAGFGGALLAHFVGAFNPAGWTPGETFLLYTAIFLGGTGNNLGAILGVFLFTGVISEATRNFIPMIPGNPDANEALRGVVGGLIIILVLRFRPQGILPEPRDKDTDRDKDNNASASLPVAPATPQLT